MKNMTMGFQNYISEAEATSFAGVSAATLSRFVEAGYLQIESDSDGLRLFSKGELMDLFGLRDDEVAEPESTSNIEPSTVSESANLASSVEVVSNSEPRSWNTIEGHAEVVDAPVKIPKESPSIYKPATTIAAPPETESAKPHKAFEAFDKEVSRLKNLAELQEKLLELREVEIRDLKEQRDWLKSRIERLEEKSDRDQLLLLAETQTIRKLITSAERQRKSKMRTTLEWFGLIAPEQQPMQVPNPLEIQGTK